MRSNRRRVAVAESGAMLGSALAVFERPLERQWNLVLRSKKRIGHGAIVYKEGAFLHAGQGDILRRLQERFQGRMCLLQWVRLDLLDREKKGEGPGRGCAFHRYQEERGEGSIVPCSWRLAYSGGNIMASLPLSRPPWGRAQNFTSHKGLPYKSWNRPG